MKLHPALETRLKRPVTMELRSGERIEFKISLIQPAVSAQDPFRRKGVMAIDTWVEGRQYGVHKEYLDNEDVTYDTLERIRTELLDTIRHTVLDLTKDQPIQLNWRDKRMRLVVDGSDSHYAVMASSDFIPVEYYAAGTKVMSGEIGSLKGHTIVVTQPGNGEDISDLLTPKQEEEPLTDFDL